MAVRAIRGAITVERNESNDIIEATKQLLSDIISSNNLNNEDIISIIFSMTNDLNAVFPAVAARELGLSEAALMCTNEIDVPGSLKKCIRLMMHINTEKKQNGLRHIYLKGAKILRPDLSK